MADMAARVKLNYLLDFYGPLLTEHRQNVMRLYCEEDMTQQEIAQELDITRQGVFDAIAKSKKQLREYEEKLKLVERYRRQTAEAEKCLRALDRLDPGAEGAQALSEARAALENIIRER